MEDKKYQIAMEKMDAFNQVHELSEDLLSHLKKIEDEQNEQNEYKANNSQEK